MDAVAGAAEGGRHMSISEIWGYGLATVLVLCLVALVVKICMIWR